MPLTPPENTSRWAAEIQDMIASDSSIREGLHDEDAIPLMDWGRAQAEQVAARLASEAPEANTEAAGEEAGALIRLMTTISRAVVHRHAQGDEWLAKVFKRLNKTSQRVYGEQAPVMSDDEVAAWIAEHAARSDGEVLRDLMARFSPPGAEAPTSADPEAAKPDPSQQPSPTPLSAILDDMAAGTSESASTPGNAPDTSNTLTGRTPPRLPGRSPAPDDLNETDSSPPSTGDENDQT